MNGDDELKTVTVTPRYQEGTMTDAVIVPILQAVITSGILGLIGAFFVAVLLHKAFLVVMETLVGVFLVAVFIFWMAYRSHWMGIIESVLGVDINGDGKIGPPEPEPPTPHLDVTLYSADHLHSQTFPVPFPERIPALMQALDAGIRFTYENFGGTGKLFSELEFKEFTKVLRGKGLIRYKNPKNERVGFEITPEGDQVFREIARNGRALFMPQRAQAYPLDVDPPAPLPWRPRMTPPVDRHDNDRQQQ